MRKSVLVIAIIAVLTLMFAACGEPANGETYGEDYGVETEMNGRFETVVDDKEETPEVTEEPEATTAPETTEEPEATTAPESTEEPKATTAPESTEEPATTTAPEPTKTPEATEAPVPTEAPAATTKTFKTVLRELHSLNSFKEREAYVEGLDKSLYKVTEVDCSQEIIEESEFQTVTRMGHFALLEDCNTKSVPDYESGYTYVILSPDTGEEVFRFEESGATDEDWNLYNDYMDKGYKEDCIVPERTVPAQVVYYAYNWYSGGEIMKTTYVDEYDSETSLYNGECNGECYFMTLTEIATGETDPWGVKVPFDAYNYQTEERSVIVEKETIEAFVNSYNKFVCEGEAWGGMAGEPMAMVTTWDTLQYYSDIFVPQTEFEIEMPW